MKIQQVNYCVVSDDHTILYEKPGVELVKVVARSSEKSIWINRSLVNESEKAFFRAKSVTPYLTMFALYIPGKSQMDAADLVAEFEWSRPFNFVSAWCEMINNMLRGEFRRRSPVRK